MLNLKAITKISLLCLIAATLLFIFIQSMIPPETSKAESDAVGGFIEEIIPPDTEVGAFVKVNLRKIAHFTEFFILGLEVSIYLILFTKKPHLKLLSLPTALITAFFDESIQMFSGRGPSVFDVWIDFFGFFFASAVSYSVFYLAEFLAKRFLKLRGVKNG